MSLLICEISNLVVQIHPISALRIASFLFQDSPDNMRYYFSVLSENRPTPKILEGGDPGHGRRRISFSQRESSLGEKLFSGSQSLDVLRGGYETPEPVKCLSSISRRRRNCQAYRRFSYP